MTDRKALFKAKKYAEIIAALDASDDPAATDIALRAQSYYLTGEFEKALTDCRHVLLELSVQAPFHLYQITRTIVGRRRLDAAATSAFWESCSDAPSQRMGEIAKRLCEGDLSDDREGLVAEFAMQVRELFPEPRVAEAWIRAFDLLSLGLSGAELPPFCLAETRRRIIVSGTGWSGSGAIYDHFREFQQVHAIPGETSVIEGGGGFRAFVVNRESVEACTDHAIRFFFRNMIGFLPMRTSSCFKELLSARKNSLDTENAAIYAEGAIDVVSAILQLIRGIGGPTTETSANLKTLCDTITERMVTYAAPQDSVVLLDNCIHVQNCGLIQYLSNTLLLCCFRDPRTNYVALRREFAGFDKTVPEYIRDVRNVRKGFAASFTADLQKELPAARSHVEVVYFEHFVVSEPYRHQLAVLARIDTTRRDNFAHFKPWASFRNTQLHLDYEKPDEILQIAEALPELCIEHSAGPTTDQGVSKI